MPKYNVFLDFNSSMSEEWNYDTQVIVDAESIESAAEKAKTELGITEEMIGLYGSNHRGLVIFDYFDATVSYRIREVGFEIEDDLKKIELYRK
ncbi:hypothetical protein D3P07_11645 [Paenibacillus sp. 1011MAR3C5]|uniref:hypothetical protein n=1 Tax=Paenibacillus sp. 1011MAR3C5 TaxID=1675787 RepID=UPI000E6C3480|nr:hypothetical protein [Paenibacillus sp. 1011MAR3C5]RJE88640.1 hypothetical protein D3P07_11645 [Paenibacillus sp. 1011MAR3C5]